MSPDPVARARGRLALQFAALSAALFVAVGAGVYLYVQHVLHASFDAGHELAVVSVLENVSRGPEGLHVDVKELAEELEELRGTLGVTAASVYGANGRQLASHGVALSATGAPRELVGSGATLAVVRRAPVVRGDARGVVVVARTAAGLAEDLAAVRRGLLLFLPLVVLGSLGAGWVMAGRTLRPVRETIDAQRAFMADASHEIRTPLSVLRAHADVRLDEDAALPAMRASLGVVARTAADLGALVDDLLFLARSDAAALAPRREPVDLEEIVEESVEAFGPVAAAKGSRLVVAVRGPVTVEGDPAQLQRLVGVLVDNALCHGIASTIDVTLDVEGAHVVLRVADGGPGIPAALLPRVFERFVRGDGGGGGAEAGHGLGLSIARSIVRAHGGTLELAENARGGTTATASLPRPRTTRGTRHRSRA